MDHEGCDDCVMELLTGPRGCDDSREESGECFVVRCAVISFRSFQLQGGMASQTFALRVLPF